MPTSHHFVDVDLWTTAAPTIASCCGPITTRQGSAPGRDCRHTDLRDWRRPQEARAARGSHHCSSQRLQRWLRRRGYYAAGVWPQASRAPCQWQSARDALYQHEEAISRHDADTAKPAALLCTKEAARWRHHWKHSNWMCSMALPHGMGPHLRSCAREPAHDQHTAHHHGGQPAAPHPVVQVVQLPLALVLPLPSWRTGGQAGHANSMSGSMSMTHCLASDFKLRVAHCRCTAQ